ncbi:hypothetical protein GW17_00050701 [Ensete ventricosum]|nr:hypothetical protein GW17_00050701 [Ensete ventricosum]
MAKAAGAAASKRRLCRPQGAADNGQPCHQQGRWCWPQGATVASAGATMTA